MTFTFNIDATCKRLFSSATPYITSIALGTAANPNGFTSTTQIAGLLNQPASPALLFKFLSTQPSDLIETKNVVPYMDFPRYLTSSSQYYFCCSSSNRYSYFKQSSNQPNPRYVYH